jgi:FSR family fosmidomycin resistance protein-like MFS transporter
MPHVVRRRGLVTGVRIAVLLALAHGVNDALTAVLGACVAGTVPVLLIRLVAGGIGSAALHPVSTSIVGGPSATNPGLAVGLFTAGGMAGFAVGPVLILYLVSTFGLGVTPWLMIPGLAFAAAVFILLPDWEPHRTAHRWTLIGRRTLTGPIGWLTGASAIISLAFITVTGAVPLWLVTVHGLAADAPLLGWTLAVFSLAAGLGAVAGGVIGPRFGYPRTATVSILAATLPLVTILLAPPGPITLIAAAAAGALLFTSQPLLIVAAQNAVPQAPAAAAGVVIGLATAVAGVLYIGSGVAQEVLGLAPAMAVNFALLVPAAYVAGRALRASAVAVDDGGFDESS